VRPHVTVPAVGAAAGALAATTPAPAPGPVTSPAADASYSGAPDTIPAMMLDGDPSTGWSNFYVKSATANLPAVSSSDASEWVALTWATAQRIGTVTATFVTGGALALPAAITVSHWNGHRFIPASGLRVSWATASGQPTTLTFDQVTTTRVRLGMTSPSPGTASGFLRIAALDAS
jgi:beta-galactosidase